MSAFIYSTNQFARQIPKATQLASRIVYIKGEGNYSMLFLNDGRKVLSAHCLAYYEGILECSHFARVHKSCLVNIACIQTFGSDEALLTNGCTVPIARRRRKELLEKIKR